MRGRLFTCDGRAYDMPTLLRYELTYTGSVPCDSFSVRCVYSTSMAEILPKVTRFAAIEEGKTAFFGVVDDYTAAYDDGGLTLELNGRGMAALLLDSESEALFYENASLKEILKNHVLPFGIACAENAAADKRFSHEVTSGTSHFSVLEDCAKKCGVEPRFTKEGKLVLSKGGGRELTLGGSFPLLAALWREKRYGVISEIAIIDRKSGERTDVRNESFLAHGGLCRRVLYATKNSVPVEAGRERIEESKKDSRLLMVTAAGKTDFSPFDTVRVTLPKLGISDEFRVSEVVRRADRSGEVTEVTMRGGM